LSENLLLHCVKLVQDPRTHHDEYIIDILGRPRLANEVHDDELEIRRIVGLDVVECRWQGMNCCCRSATERDEEFAEVEQVVLLLENEALVHIDETVTGHSRSRQCCWQCYRA
jgi:hypothetical protein